MKNYVLHFIRHGRTEHQRQGVYMGRRTGSELSAEGIGELLALRREYDYPSAEVVFSSPLPHCLQTAESRLMVVDELAEMDFGVYEGKSLEELKDDPEFGRWLADSHHQKPPEGESGEEFLIRIQAAVAAMIDYMAQNEIFEAAVVTHGGVIATLMSTGAAAAAAAVLENQRRAGLYLLCASADLAKRPPNGGGGHSAARGSDRLR